MLTFKGSRHRPALAIIDEDRSFADGLCAALSDAGYRCTVLPASSARELELDSLGVKALIVDLADPQLDRVGQIRRLRAASEVPILVVTRASDECDKVSALDAGADDYVTKPLALGEFLARLRVQLRHGRARCAAQPGHVEVGDLRIALLDREVKLAGARVPLTPTDYKLLALLARNLGRVVERQQLLREGWGPNAHDPHCLRVYMARLRRKLDPERRGVRYIVTEPGVGYRLSTRVEPTVECDTAAHGTP